MPQRQPAPEQRCTPQALLQHADNLERTAARGGYLLANGQRVTLPQATRERWARDAALFRQLALEEEHAQHTETAQQSQPASQAQPAATANTQEAP